MTDIFERLKNSEPIHMINVKEYHAVAHKEMDRCRKLCFTINHTYPEREKLIPLEKELFQNRIADTAFVTPHFRWIMPVRWFLRIKFYQSWSYSNECRWNYIRRRCNDWTRCIFTYGKPR